MNKRGNGILVGDISVTNDLVHTLHSLRKRKTEGGNVERTATKS
jgi:hypothetical protein